MRLTTGVYGIAGRVYAAWVWGYSTW